jgi:hypothetical protein
MAKIGCPFWLGYLLIHPIRKLFENPMLRETPDPERFLEEIRQALKKEGRLFIREPKVQVSKRAFEHRIALAQRRGFSSDGPHSGPESHQVLLKKG